MSWVFMVSVVVLLIATALIELRAVRIGDERRHHAPGYALVMGGIIVIGVGIAAAVAERAPIALLASCAGLLAVALGATRPRGLHAH